MDPLAPSLPQPARIYWWARQHAMILLFGVGAAWLEHSGVLLAAMAGASFLGVFRMPRTIVPASSRPLAVTILETSRILAALALIAEPLWNVTILLTLIGLFTILQMLEAWLRRSRTKKAPDEALIEQEIDGLWIIAIAFLLVPLAPLGQGILWLAIVRPLWVMTTHWTGAPRCAMPWNLFNRWVSALSILALATPMVPGIPPEVALSFLAAGGVGWMALHATWAIKAWRHRP